MKKLITRLLLSITIIGICPSFSFAAALSAVPGSEAAPKKVLKKPVRKSISQSGSGATSTGSVAKPEAPAAKAVEEAVAYEEVTLIATAYYSPLPNQKYYLRGNYEAELLLNGNGTHGASGRPVFNGMLAAPKGYSFGTKIWVEGFGVGSVEDRGGAIVPTGTRGNAFDRVDIWMGYGEEGLGRALAWGRRTVKARKYVSNQTAVTFDFSKIKPANLSKSVAKVNKPTTDTVSLSLSSASKSSSQIASKTVSENTPKPDELELKMNAFNREKTRVKEAIDDLGTPKIGDTGPEIRMLQEVLIDMGYLDGKSTAIYGPATKAAIAEFQKSTKLIITLDDPNAGTLGQVTRAKLVDEILFRGIEI